MPSKITIIGGAGFVGTNFCQQLADQQIPFEIIDLKLSQRFPEKVKLVIFAMSKACARPSRVM